MFSKKQTLSALIIAVIILFSFTLVGIAQVKVVTKEEYESAQQKYDDLKQQITQKQVKMQEARDNQDLALYEQYKGEYEELLNKIKEPEAVIKAYMDYRQVVSDVARAYQEGQQSFRLKRYSQAVQNYDEAINKGKGIDDDEIKDILARAYYQKGLSLVQLKMYEDAIASYEMVKQIDPQSHLANFGLGRIYEQMNRPEEAVKNYRAAIEKGPKYLPARYSLAVLYYQGMKKPEEALTVLENLFAAVPDNGNSSYESTVTRSYYLKGRILQELRKFKESLEPLKKAIELNNRFYQAYYYLADSYLTIGNNQEAIKYATEGIKHRRGFGGFYLVRGKAYKKMGNESQALKEFEQASKDRIFQKQALYEIDLIKNKDKYTR